MLRIGIVGLGYWGPNLVRVLDGLPDCEVVAICDLNQQRLREYCERFPNVMATTNTSEILTRDVIDAVVLATPTKTHFSLACEAMAEGLHTFVEKPLATSTEECEALIELSEKQQVTLFVGHVFLYSAPVAKLRELVTSGELGTIYYMSSTRLNLGPVRSDVNALWDLAPHDVSIMLELMGSPPISVSCSGLAHLNQSVQDVCTVAMHFEDNRFGIAHVSWLDPHKKREMTVVGSNKMAIYNDIHPLEKIKIYDHGVEAPPKSEYGEFQVSYRYGDMYCPRLEEVEPLKAECSSFILSILQNTTPKTDGRNGLNVVRVIEAANKSLKHDGVHVALEPGTLLAEGKDSTVSSSNA